MSTLDAEKRSAIMSAVRSKNTSPELRVRSALHRRGMRFRLHRTDLPGTPDIILPRWKIAIFVHGCFWHQHPGCNRASKPATNVEFWEKKFSRNNDRDMKQKAALEAIGWKVAVIWECETKDSSSLENALNRSLVSAESR